MPIITVTVSSQYSSKVLPSTCLSINGNSFQTNAVLYLNSSFQALFQGLCIYFKNIFFPKYMSTLKCEKLCLCILKEVKLSKRKIQFIIYFKQKTRFLLIPKKQNNSNHLFSYYVKKNLKKKNHKPVIRLLESDPQPWYYLDAMFPTILSHTLLDRNKCYRSV